MNCFKRMVIIAMPIVSMAASAVAADSSALKLTELRTGDCVADRVQLSQPRSRDEIERDVKWCSEVDVPGLDREDCKKQKRKETTKDMPFFSDRCSKRDFFLSLNGREYRLTRTSPAKSFKKSPLEGKFEGQGVALDVKLVKVLKNAKDGAVESGTADVLVNVAKGEQRGEFKAILSYGPQ
jgi:hypothetical protein